MSDEPRLSPERRAAMQRWLADRMSAQRRRRRRTAIAAAASGGVIVLGLVAWMVVAPQEVQDRWVDCYATASVDAPFATAVRSGADTIEDRNALALAACGELWKHGLIDNEKHADAPTFVLCQRTDLSLAAYPLSEGTDAAALCEVLGQKPPARGE